MVVAVQSDIDVIMPAAFPSVSFLGNEIEENILQKAGATTSAVKVLQSSGEIGFLTALLQTSDEVKKDEVVGKD